MIFSRILLAVALALLGGMVYWVHLDLLKIEEKVGKPDIPIQMSVGVIGKPRVAPIKHLYKKPRTVVDTICEK
jgi:hypothetical protein